MPATQEWIQEADARLEKLADGVFWIHDGNPKRPYVKLRTGDRMSNVYFNGSKACEVPYAFDELVDEVVTEWQTRAEDEFLVDRVVGPAMGAIPLAYSTARSIGPIQESNPKFSYAEKDGDEFVFRRNPPQNGERILLVEDTITSGTSVLKVRDAILKVAPNAIIIPYVIALCNRSGKDEIEGLEVVSYIDGDFRDWAEGENPFTSDGKELVPAVGDAKKNWDLLTKDY